jgi:hypothetical protein
MLYLLLMPKRPNIKEIIACCEARYGSGNSENWKHSDFIGLQREIFRQTKVNISPSTLKRIFGKVSVDDDYIPQQATLEALASYGGYSVVTDQAHDTSHFSEGKVLETKVKRYSKSRLAVLGIAIIVTILISVWLIRSGHGATGTIHLTAMEGVLPSSAFFELDVPETKDSVFIDFGDKSSLALVKHEQREISHNYLIPGVFDVRMFTRNRKLSATKVSVKSNKWIGLGFRRQRELPEHYYAFPADRIGPDSLFHISNTELKKLGIDTTGSLFTRLSNYTDVGQSADSFVFETSFKNNVKTKGIYCHATQVKIAGLNGMIRFRFVNQGCSAQANIVMGEQRFEGSMANLSALVLNLDAWNTVKVVNNKQRLSLYVNGKLSFEGKYDKSLGEVKGLFVEFEGNGFVKTCNLSAPDGKVLLHF